MAEMTEHHSGAVLANDPWNLLRECIPDRPVVPVVNALVKGMGRHGAWDVAKGRESIMGSLGRHVTALTDGECYDSEDGQHHAASIVLRALQILDLDHRLG